MVRKTLNTIAGCAIGTALLIGALNEASAAIFSRQVQDHRAQDLPAQSFPPIPAPYEDLLAVADAEIRRQVSFKCMACHMFKRGEPNMQGPNLFEVAGRDVASYPGYRFSTGVGSLSELEGVWTPERLDHFMRAPRQFAPSTKSSFKGLSRLPGRINLIAYLRTLTASAQAAGRALQIPDLGPRP